MLRADDAGLCLRLHQVSPIQVGISFVTTVKNKFKYVTTRSDVLSWGPIVSRTAYALHRQNVNPAIKKASNVIDYTKPRSWRL
jgi:hypothetical protein